MSKPRYTIISLMKKYSPKLLPKQQQLQQFNQEE
jgi:hypothetical protein